MATLKSYKFGDYRLVPDQCRLYRLDGNGYKHISGKPLEVLLYLVTQPPNRVISNEEFREKVWKVAKLNANTIAQQFTELNEKLGNPKGEAKTYISREKGVGTSFLKTVVEEPFEVNDAVPEPIWNPEPQVSAAARSRSREPRDSRVARQPDDTPLSKNSHYFSWFVSAARLQFALAAGDLLAIMKHPLRFAEDIARSSIDRRRILGFILLATGVALPFFYLARPRGVQSDSYYIFNALGLLAIATPLASLFLASLWRAVGTAKWATLLRVSIYFSMVSLLAPVVSIGLADALISSAMNAVGPAPSSYYSTEVALHKVIEDLGECSEAQGFITCLNTSQPISLTPSKFWSRDVYQKPLFWSGVLALFAGIVFATIYNALICKAMGRIAGTRRVLAWFIFPVAFIIPGALGVLMSEGTKAIVGNGLCNVPISKSPMLNLGPIMYGDANRCADFPLIDAGLVSSGHWSTSAQDHTVGVMASPNDVVGIRIWLDNGAADNLDPEQVTARNVRIRISTLRPTDKTIVIRAEAFGDNTPFVTSADPKYGGDATIRSTEAVDAGVIPSAACIIGRQSPVNKNGFCDTAGGDRILTSQDLRGWFNVGNIKPGYENADFIRLRLQIRPRAKVQDH